MEVCQWSVPQLVDTTLREGVQSIHPLKHDRGIVFTKKQRLSIVDMLIDFGIDYIEVGAPVRSDFSFNTVRAIVKRSRGTGTKILAHCRCTKSDIDAALDAGVDGVNLYFNSSAFGVPVEQGIEIILDVIDHLEGKEVLKRFSFEDAFRTPFDTIKLVTRGILGKIDRLGLPDTTGTAFPDEVASVVKAIREAFPNLDLEVHFHNDTGLAVANALYALRSGASVINTTILGLGERTGLVPLSGMIAVLCKEDTMRDALSKKYNLVTLPYMCKEVASMLGIHVPLCIPISSPGAFTHVAGVHADGHGKDKGRYRGIDPSLFGRDFSVCFASSVVGKASILWRARELGVRLSSDKARMLADMVRENAVRKGGITTAKVDKMIKLVGTSK